MQDRRFSIERLHADHRKDRKMLKHLKGIIQRNVINRIDCPLKLRMVDWNNGLGLYI